MSRRIRLLRRPRSEGGFALLMTIVLMLMLAVLAVAVLDQAFGESTHSRAAQTVDGSYQAAEAGLNAYTAKLLEDSYYATHFLAAGEATRTVVTTAYPSASGADTSIVGTPAASASSWSYASKDAWTCSRTSDCPTGTVYLPGSGYQYDIEVCPPIVLGGVGCGGFFGAGSNPYTRIIATGRPSGNTDRRTWRAIELDVKPFSLSDFQMFSRASVSYGSTATTYGPVYSQGDVTHDGSALANVMAEGNVKTGGGSPNIRITAPARTYDIDTSPDIRHAPGLSTKPNFANFQGSQATGKTAAQTSGIYLSDSSKDAWKLKFLSNGTVEVYSCKKGLKTAPSTYYDISQVTQVNGVNTTTPSPVCTQYIVSGKPWPVPVPAFGAIYAEQSVLVEGVVSGRVTVLTYVDAVVSNNITYNGPNDVLGIIANHDVVIAEYVPDHLIWHAAVIAQTGSFHSYTPTTVTRSLADFYGSTTTYGGGSMGMFSTRNYYFDTVLKYIAPPFFPTLDNELSVVLQREVSP